MTAVVGRAAVLDDMERALRGCGTVLLEGPAGIGKTAVFRELVERAEAAGALVLSCAPTEAETALPLAAVADLLQPVADLVPELPDAQRAAVDAALSGEAVVDERALSAAVRSLCEGASAGDRPVLVAVDDAPWLDPPSERALRYAVRRVTGSIGLLVTARTSDDSGGPVPLGLQSAPELTRVSLPPLGVGALHHVLRTRFGVNFSRPIVARLAHDSGGNALLAIEMARAMLRLPVLPGPADDLPVVASMQELVAATLAVLEPDSRHAVRLAALLAAPKLSVLTAAGMPAAALEPAEEAGLLAVRPDDRVEFAHPVYAAAVRASIPPGVRRRLHRELADVCPDPDERSRQLARCTTAADATVAAELAAAAERARGRGAPELAADLYDRAAELTPDAQAAEREQRRLTAVHCRYDSGDYGAAGAQAEAIARAAQGERQSEALLLRAAIAWSADDPFAAVDAAQRALAVAGPSTLLAGRIHAHLGVFVDLPGPARSHAEAALRLLAGAAESDRPATASSLLARSDTSLLASALMLLFLNEVRSGLPARLDVLDEALRLEGSEPSWLAGTVPAIWWKGVDDRDRAVDRLLWMLDRAGALGEEPFQHEVITHLGEAELLAGRFDAAGRWIAQARELGEQLDTGTAAETWLAGMLDAHLGRLDEAAAAARTGLRQADETGEPWLRRINLLLAGFTALSAGRVADASASYAALAEEMDATGLVEPLGTRYEADWAEAAAAAGDLPAAENALERLAARHSRLPRTWTALGLARGAVLLAGATGRPVDEPVEALLAAREAVAPDVLPFDRARCLLVAGQAQRRARRKSAARDALERAAAEFDALGASAHAARARAEAARVGGRAVSPFALTETENQFARLAAHGRTNKAIADALFVSPKTVEANLARVYRKLGITNRAELSEALARQT
jgi:DNA-binding CsgD family transcriptional regulator